MKRVVAILIAGAALAGVVLVIMGTISDDSQAPSSGSEAVIGANYYSLRDTTGEQSINMFAMQPVDASVAWREDTIESITFANEEMEVENVRVSTGGEHSGHILLNIILNVRYDNTGLETTEDMTVTFTDGTTETHTFGEMSFRRSDSHYTEVFGTLDDYRVTYEDVHFEAALENEAAETIHLRQISDNQNVLSYQFEPALEMAEGSREDISITFDVEDEAYDFYTLHPVVHYSREEGAEETIALPPVQYNVFLSDEEKAERILTE
ncbi:hypothetical protein [Alkalicoccus urumqiensis]|uniref:Uncharacterized protein n=1 Tax=Alkalicoccus urumqiensis TaxID=1548213 RepID=A0A2P6MJI8_ALKUR|nr:hypothetical protein [Alkalicoccus urumqiensis]PRO66449.1 hypothetical protein C6I21_03665 [Alkalicoccus urumqiensis]